MMNNLSTSVRPVSRALPLAGPCRLGRVLVVDDDREARDLILAELADHQCHAVASSRGEVGYHLQHSQFSLVILDVCAGRIDGFAVLRRIRAHSDVPVILTTRHRQNEVDRILGLELGADEFSRDPLNPRELLARASHPRDEGARGRLRSQHRRAGAEAEAQDRGRSVHPRADQDRTRRRLHPRCPGRGPVLKARAMPRPSLGQTAQVRGTPPTRIGGVSGTGHGKCRPPVECYLPSGSVRWRRTSAPSLPQGPEPWSPETWSRPTGLIGH